MISRPATSWSVGRAALIAGAALLLMAVVAGLAKFVALDGLITPGDAARTATDIIGSADTFRFGTLGLILVIVLDVIVACALYRVFSAVNSSISLLAAGFRLVFAAVFLAAVGRLVGAARLLDGDATLSVFTPAQLHALASVEITAFDDLWTVALGLFGVHLLLVGYLVFRSGYAPRLLGILLAVAGLGYMIDGVGTVLSTRPWTSIGAFTFVGELWLALWLVIRGPRIVIDLPIPTADQDSATTTTTKEARHELT